MAAVTPLVVATVTPGEGLGSGVFTVSGKVSGTAGIPTGTITLQNITGAGTATLASGLTLDATGAFTWSGSMPSGTYLLNANFVSSNTSVYNNTSEQYIPVNIISLNTTTLVIQPKDQVLCHRNGTITATIYISLSSSDTVGTRGVVTPGEFALYLGNKQIGRVVAATLINSALFADSTISYSGSITFSASLLSVGTNTLTAKYSGSYFGNYLSGVPSTSAPVTINVIQPQTYSFTLPSAATTTSAVVKGSAGNQVRTIWVNKPMPAGAGVVEWDGLDDFGNLATADTYSVVVQYGSPTYTWNGVVGNTSYDNTVSGAPNFGGTNVWDMSGGWPSDCTISGTEAYFACGYAEIRIEAMVASLSSMQSPVPMMSYQGQDIQYSYIATDGTRVYMADTGGGWSGQIACVVAYSATSPYTQYQFPNGVSTVIGNPVRTGVIDLGTVNSDGTLTNQATGLAVQQSSNVLAVSHGDFWSNTTTLVTGSGTVKLFDKVSGASLGTIVVTNPRRCTFDLSNNLWVICGGSGVNATSVVQYTGVGSTNTQGLSLTGLVAPLAIATDPTTGDVLVMDGGTSQQIKRFSSSTGSLISTLGTAGGMTDGNANITNDRYYFDSTPGQGGRFSPYMKAWLAVASDSSVWFSDAGNARMMHLSSTGTYLGRVTFFPADCSYYLQVDKGNPNRLFTLWMEYAVDYTKTLTAGDPDTSLGGNGCWTLVRNWSVAFPKTYCAPVSIATLSNGSTYALVDPVDGGTSYGMARPSNTNFGYNCELVQLNSTTGTVTFSGVKNYSYVQFNNNLALAGEASGTVTYNGTTYSYSAITAKTVTGFSSGWPTFGSAVTVASATFPTPASGTTRQYPLLANGWGGPSPWDETTGGYYVMYNTQYSTLTPSYHLGGIKAGATAQTPPLTTYSWFGCPSGQIVAPDGAATFAQINCYSGHNGQQALVAGAYVIATYDGQYASVGNQYMLYTEDGIFVGQFGTAVLPAGQTALSALVAGYAGNIARFQAVLVSGNIHCFSSDESCHAGIHWWTIGNLSSLARITCTPVQPTMSVS